MALALIAACVAVGERAVAQRPTFVLAVECAKDGANHVHTVWRDLERDFGGDLLRAHHETAHLRPIPRSDL